MLQFSLLPQNAYPQNTYTRWPGSLVSDIAIGLRARIDRGTTIIFFVSVHIAYLKSERMQYVWWVDKQWNSKAERDNLQKIITWLWNKRILVKYKYI